MATKTIHKIEVDSAQFKDFYDLFKKYSAELEDLPEEWKKVTGETDNAGKAMEGFAAVTGTSKESLALAAAQAHIISQAISGVTKGTHDGTKAQKDFLVSLRASGSVMKAMAHDAKALGSSIFGIGRFLMRMGGAGLKLTGLGALLGGGFGVLSMLGLDRMAHSAVSTQGQARGVGISVGQLEAFRTDFGRYADPSILNRVAQAQGDMSQWAYLQNATGVGMDRLSTMSPAEMSIAMMRRARNWWDSTPANMRNIQALGTTGLDKFYSFEEVRRLGAMSQSEFSDAAGQFSKDSRSLQVSDRANDAWYQFERQLILAGKTINADFTRKLSVLGPSLGKLETAITKDGLYLVDHFLTPENLKKLTGWIDEFTTYLGSDKFKTDMHDFVTLVGAVVQGLGTLAAWFVKTFGAPSPSSETMAAIPGTGKALDGSVVGLMRGGSVAYLHDSNPLREWMTTTRDSMHGNEGKEDYLTYLEREHHLPAGLLDAVWNQESARGKNAGFSKSRALGDFQFMAATGKAYGLTTDEDRRDFFKSARAAATLYEDELYRSHGDLKMALAGYNWGDKRLNEDIRANGSNWEANAPAKTQNYIKQIIAALARRQAIKLDVHVTNNTGSNVAVSANAAAVGG